MTPDDTRELAAEVARLVAEHHSPPPLLNAEQAGALLNVPHTWLLAEARRDRVPHVRLGKYVRFERDALTDWIKGRSR